VGSEPEPRRHIQASTQMLIILHEGKYLVAWYHYAKGPIISYKICSVQAQPYPRRFRTPISHTWSYMSSRSIFIGTHVLAVMPGSSYALGQYRYDCRPTSTAGQHIQYPFPLQRQSFCCSSRVCISRIVMAEL